MQQMAWFSPVRAWHSVKKKFPPLPLGAILFLWVYTNSVHAVDLQTILTNISNVIGPLTGMVLMISYVAGVYMIFHGINGMKKMGNMTSASHQSQPGEMSGPLLHIIVGAVLIYLPTSTDTFMNTIFSTNASIFSGGGSFNYKNMGEGASLIGYMPGDSIGQQWASIANTLVLYIQFLGLLSFIKGWFLISKSAGPGAQPGNFTKGMTHIIGGIVAINFIGAVNIISNTIYGT